tara:strand:+ start:5700 stop:5867 length:168 start_codon:yes stop_codon:yes gene_type:complete
MTTKQLTESIKQIMTDTQCTELEAISGLQTAASKMGDDKILEALCEMKWAIINAA